MTTYSRAQIEQHVFGWGSSEQRACFLVSKAAAERVGTDVRRSLRAQGYQQADHPQFISIEADPQWVGTFTISVRMPGLTSPDPNKAEKLAVQRVRAALKAAVRHEDIVQTWTRPPRR